MTRPYTRYSTLLALASSALVVGSVSCSKKESSETTSTDTSSQAADTKPAETKNTLADFDTLPDTTKDPRDGVENMGMTMDFTSPETVVEKLAKLLSESKSPEDIDKIIQIIGQQSISEEELAQLKARLNGNGIALDPTSPFEQIGELRPGQHSRYAIKLADKSRIFLDLKKEDDGKWKVENMKFPDKQSGLAGNDHPDAQTDALNYAHSFLEHLLNQRFEQARAMVDTKNVNDAKLAGLCIIFEEAQYKLDKNKPLRAIYLRDRAAGFYAKVSSANGKTDAQFSVITQRDKAGDPWQIYEINLDKLLGDYAKQVAGGDIHYSPLIKNPAGGETLVIYFEFDSDGLTPRTKHQLDIVVGLLKLDPNKKINISGHTDSIGSNAYNEGLSEKRAETVKSYLASQGVPQEQIVTKAYGQSQPRLPNTRQDGTDDPSGRRANRRTEIYLDF
ncbi:peptidoglycan-associated lipoprotein [Rubritalea halochordaticola]|uniref:Peptidoglycan-associated lipoprotein n=1 Tax=Rubritalea halochordaticola TaxID=714537 RepID=A0ABP9V285_9BACT